MGCMGGCGGGSKKSTPQKQISTGTTRKVYAPAGGIQGYAGNGKPKIKLSFGRNRG